VAVSYADRADRGARGPATRSRASLGVAVAVAVVLGVALWGCHAARVLAPPPPLRAASATPYAVDVEFAEPLDQASAEDPARYTLVPVVGPATPVAIASATLIDTLNRRTVQLLIPDWLSTDTDTLEFDLTTTGVISYEGRSTGTRTLRFRTGLSYRNPMRALFDAKCSSCHGAAQAQGSYRTDSYVALFGNGTDATPDVIAGNPQCLTVRKCKPKNSMFNAADLSYLDFEMILNWVASYNARL